MHIYNINVIFGAICCTKEEKYIKKQKKIKKNANLFDYEKIRGDYINF